MSPNQRPIIKLKLTKLDIVLEAVSVMLLVAMWGFVIVRMFFPSCLSPEFFRLDKWGWLDFVFPVITSWVILGMLRISCRTYRPKQFFVKITEENAERHYRLLMRHNRFNAIIFGSMFCWIVVEEHLIRSEASDKVMGTVLLTIFVFLLLVGVYYGIKSWMLR